jgi:hypothetical protein
MPFSSASMESYSFVPFDKSGKGFPLILSQWLVGEIPVKLPAEYETG